MLQTQERACLIRCIFSYSEKLLIDTQGVHQWIVVPSLRWIFDDAEEAHEAGTKSLKVLYQFGLHPRERGKTDEAGDLEVEVIEFSDSHRHNYHHRRALLRTG